MRAATLPNIQITGPSDGNRRRRGNRLSLKGVLPMMPTFFSLSFLLLCSVWIISIIIYHPEKTPRIISQPPENLADKKNNIKKSAKEQTSYPSMGRIVYGAKSKEDKTAQLVSDAINSGFFHIATGSMHREYNEAGVGEGWKKSKKPRSDIYLQTLFTSKAVPDWSTENCAKDVCGTMDRDTFPDDIEEQVKLSIKSSLINLQTDYLDALLFHNFRAKSQPYDVMLKAWQTLETYVDKGVIRHLGITNIHDEDFLRKLHKEAKHRPVIVQNRFHANRNFDVTLRPTFKELGMANQLFWVLTGNGRSLKDDVFQNLCKKYNATKEQIMYAFVISIGGTPLIGTKRKDHMELDVNVVAKDNQILLNDAEKENIAKVLRMKLL